MKLRLEVGQPLGFDAGDGTNVITGDVAVDLSGSREVVPLIAEVHPQKKAQEEKEKVIEYWFVINCKPVAFEEMRFLSLLMMPRYRTKKPPLDLLKDGLEIVCNCMWRHDGRAWDKDSIKAAQEGTIEVEGILVVNVRCVDEGVKPAPPPDVPLI